MSLNRGVIALFLAVLLGCALGIDAKRVRARLRAKAGTQSKGVFFSNPYAAEAAAEAYKEEGLLSADDSAVSSEEQDVESAAASELQDQLGIDVTHADEKAAAQPTKEDILKEQVKQRNEAADGFQTNFFLRGRQNDKRLSVAKAKSKRVGATVTMKDCGDMAAEIGAMSCSLVTQISGYPEGCECQMRKSKCPDYKSTKAGADVFTGLSPSDTLFGVTLCMYWQWLDAPDKTKENALVYETSLKNTKELVKTAETNALTVSAAIAAPYFALMPTPFPVPSEWVPGPPVAVAAAPGGAPAAAPA